MPTLLPSTPAELTVFPHHESVTGWYETAKNMIRAETATPAVNAEDSRYVYFSHQARFRRGSKYIKMKDLRNVSSI